MLQQDKKRKEVSLDQKTIDLLQIQAKKQGRKLKNYMEYVLTEKANAPELSQNYKDSIDGLLEKHREGTLAYKSWDTFKSKLNS